MPPFPDLLAPLLQPGLVLVRRLRPSRCSRGRHPGRTRLTVEELEGRLVPASTADLVAAIEHVKPLLVAIPRKHITGAPCHRQFARIRQAIQQVQWTPTGDPTADAADQVAFETTQTAFLNALDQAEMKCGGGMGGGGGHPVHHRLHHP